MTSAQWREGMLLVVALICFFFSGAAGLIYEVVWMRMLTQIFGNTTYAIATVLTAFMGGLALGSYVFGRIADRGKNDFLLYGVLEAGVGVYGLFVPWLFGLGQQIYIPLFGLSQSQPTAFNLLLFLLCFVLLAIPTLLMGATLPVLSRFFVRSFVHLGRRVGDLYATNTMGAVLGCAFAGYYLIPALGMRQTVYAAASLNLFIAAVIFIVDGLRSKEPAGLSPGVHEEAKEPAPETQPSWLGWVLLLSLGLSGFAALVYENAWTRALTLVIGSSVYSFTTMLVTFLVGLSLGGFLYARWLGERQVRLTTFGLIELLVGLTALATIPLFERLPLLFLRLLQAFGDSFSFFLTIQIILSGLVMIIPTVLLGMTFPLVARLFTQSLYKVGTGVGTSYAANTVGAILGAFAGGFIFVPWIGVQNSIIVAVALNLLVGWFLVVSDPRLSLAPRTVLGVVVLAAVILIPLKTPPWDRHIMTSGVTIYRDRFEGLPTDSLRKEEMRRDDTLYYREGLTATISVHRIIDSDYLYFRTNGKIDGSYGDALSQLITGYLPGFFHPQGERAAVIGLGTGMTAKAVGAFPFREIEVLEIEPAMVEASKFFNEASAKLPALPSDLQFPESLRDKIRYDSAQKALVFKGVMLETERDGLLALSRDQPYQEALQALFRKSRYLRQDNILADKRVRVIATDGRNYILATPKLYHVITAEPSNPWIAGIANLYTREFYDIVKSKLTEDGIFAQWIHNYSMSPDDLRMVFRTFAESFPYVSLWGMKESDFLLLGSKKEHVFNYPALKELYARSPRLEDDFSFMRLSDIYAVLGLYRMGRKELLTFSEGARINTDDGGELEFSAPKNVRRPTAELNRKLMEPFFTEAPWLDSGGGAVSKAMHHFYLAEAYQANARHSRALEAVNQAIQIDPRNANFYVLKTEILLEQDESADAAEAALRALERSSDMIRPVLALSDEFYLRQAQAIYGKTIAMGTRELTPYLGLGKIALHQSDLKEAEKWLARARSIKSDHPALLTAWGQLMLAKGESQKARELLEQAADKGEKSAIVFGVLGEVYAKLELWEQAARSYEQAVRLRRRHHNWRLALGIALAKLGKSRQAEEKFRQVLELNPDNTEAWRELQKLGKTY